MNIEQRGEERREERGEGRGNIGRGKDGGGGAICWGGVDENLENKHSKGQQTSVLAFVLIEEEEAWSGE